MKTLNQAMGTQTIQNITLGKETCDGCGEEVEIRKTIVEIIPGRTREATGRIGCKCEEKQLAAETLAAAERIKKQKLISVFETHSLVPPELQKVTMKDYQPQNEKQAVAKKKAIEFVHGFDVKQPHNLLLYGPYGTGKSHLAYCMSKGIMVGGHSSIFISVPKLFRKLKSTYSNDSEITEDILITALETVDLLILDDIGAESESKWTREKVFDIVDSRQGKHTIYTSNYSPKSLIAKLGERNFSRVLNKDTEPFEIDGDNHRLSKFIGGQQHA
ncbi:ATP-binding protein [Peribacillus frigoritolerans]|uniref:ATP-binding protein n=1 Tax=Peribacillus frigoritolerans TaxID=450367 RepID=UPI0021D05796|nr:ATP-binding protein [Peribacillus frigoritolerans]MCU6603786.1 ATP-binding protein [Peribacillus frigoritolerans]